MYRIHVPTPCLISLIVLLFAPVATADLLLDAGTQFLLPNQDNQAVTFAVVRTEGEQVTDLDFRIQVGDGGSLIGGSDSSTTVPTISSVDLATGTIFSGGAQTDNLVDPLITDSNISVGSAVDADGIIATVFFNTQGLVASLPVTVPLQLEITGISSTEFGPSFTTFLNPGSLIVVPEPSAFLGVGLVGLLFGLSRRVCKVFNWCCGFLK